MIWTFWCWLLGRPQGMPMVVLCAWCGERHIDTGIWIYKAHSKHLCAACGRTFFCWTPGGPHQTRGI